MSEQNTTVEPTPAATPSEAPADAPTTPETPAAAPTPDAAAAPAAAKPQAPPPKGKRPFRGDKPKQDRPKLDFTSMTVNLKLNDLDKDIEAELLAAMSGFESEIEHDSEAAKQESIKKAQTPKEPGGKKKGKVLSIHGNDVFIDVPGGRSQGMMSMLQFDTPPKIGDEVEFAVEGYDSENGVLKLTKQGSAQHVDWSSVQIGQTVEARVTGVNKGGLSVEVNGIRAFMPISQIDIYRVENTEQFLNQRLICMVAEVIPSERNLVVSRKALLEREREQLREKFWEGVEEGQVLKGTIRGIQPFGAFVDLGGADGLLPVSELSWGRVGAPSDVVSIGQQVEVKVKRIDRAARKLSLSLKDLIASPWDTLSSRFPPGSTATVKVTRIQDFGAFAEVEPGVEGLIHVSEMTLGRGSRIRDRVQEGKDVEVQILSIDKDARRMSLSMKALEVAKQKEEAEAAKALMANREAAEEAEEEEAPKPKKQFPFTLRGGK